MNINDIAKAVESHREYIETARSNRARWTFGDDGEAMPFHLIAARIRTNLTLSCKLFKAICNKMNSSYGTSFDISFNWPDSDSSKHSTTDDAHFILFIFDPGSSAVDKDAKYKREPVVVYIKLSSFVQNLPNEFIDSCWVSVDESSFSGDWMWNNIQERYPGTQAWNVKMSCLSPNYFENISILNNKYSFSDLARLLAEAEKDYSKK